MIKVSNFPNAYKEVYTILQYVEKEELNNVPKEFINMLQKNMNPNYIYEYDIYKEFEEQKMLRETKAIFAYIFLHFWANEVEKNKIKAKLKQDLKKNTFYNNI